MKEHKDIMGEWEPVNSPEYISYCEANNHGYCHGVTTDGMYVRQKIWCSDDVTNKEHRFLITSTYDPFTETRKAPKPYRISSQDGTYRTEAQIRQDFINSLPQGISIPLGTLVDKKDLPKFKIDYENNDRNL